MHALEPYINIISLTYNRTIQRSPHRALICSSLSYKAHYPIPPQGSLGETLTSCRHARTPLRPRRGGVGRNRRPPCGISCCAAPAAVAQGAAAGARAKSGRACGRRQKEEGTRRSRGGARRRPPPCSGAEKTLAGWVAALICGEGGSLGSARVGSGREGEARRKTARRRRWWTEWQNKEGVSGVGDA